MTRLYLLEMIFGFGGIILFAWAYFWFLFKSARADFWWSMVGAICPIVFLFYGARRWETMRIPTILFVIGFIMLCVSGLMKVAEYRKLHGKAAAKLELQRIFPSPIKGDR